MTQRYSVSGTLSPDATTADTGVAAGTYNEESYWTWTNDAGTWYLWYWKPFFGSSQWSIGPSAPGGLSEIFWIRSPGEEVVGDYIDNGPSSTGTATVAEYVEPAPTEYAVLTINDGPLAGQYIVLKTR